MLDANALCEFAEPPRWNGRVYRGTGIGRKHTRIVRGALPRIAKVTAALILPSFILQEGYEERC